MRGIWVAWEAFCGKLKVSPDKALAMGWGDVPESFKHGVAAEFLGKELGAMIEPDQETHATVSGLYEHVWKRIEDYGSWS